MHSFRAISYCLNLIFIFKKFTALKNCVQILQLAAIGVTNFAYIFLFSALIENKISITKNFL